MRSWRNNTPFLGICLGLQLLFEESEESPGVKGLGNPERKDLTDPGKRGFEDSAYGLELFEIIRGRTAF